MRSDYYYCMIMVAFLFIAGIGVGLAYSASIDTQNVVQSEWCTVISDGSMVISEDDTLFETPFITYTDSSSRSGFMTIIFEIGASGETNLEGSVLSISSSQLGSGTIGSCVLKSSDSTYTGIISGFYVSSGLSFTITGQLSSGSMSSVSMDIIVYPEVVS